MNRATPSRPRARTNAGQEAVSVELSAVIVAASSNGPRVLVREDGSSRPAALPSGPLESEHRTLEAGLRARVKTLTGERLGYVEQLYTFGDTNRHASARGLPVRALSVGYLALARESRSRRAETGTWADWYHYFPWEDWRSGEPAILDRIRAHIAGWIAEAPRDERRAREARLQLTFGASGDTWNEELTLERYELLYEIGLVPEAHRDGAPCWAPREAVIAEADSLEADHRRILATGISRLRGKIKYRPVVFELMSPRFTFLQLQQTVEALAGIRLHKPNFRRLVQNQGLVEETGEVTQETGGRPAKLYRFRRSVLLERPASGVRVPGARRRAT